MIKDAKKGDEWLFFSFQTHNPEDVDFVFNFYKDFDADRKTKGIIIKGIINKKIIKQARINERPNVQFLVTDSPTIMNTTIFQDKVLFTPWEYKQISFLIHSKQLADSFRTYFYSVWNENKRK